MKVGSVLVINETANTAIVRVTDIVDNTINFVRLTANAIAVAIGATAKSRDFTLEVYFKNILVETWEKLSMYPENATEYS